MVSFKSCPYRQSQASKRRESRAPNPVGLTVGSSKSLDAMDTAFSAGIAISKPSSPVYPHLMSENCSEREDFLLLFIVVHMKGLMPRAILHNN